MTTAQILREFKEVTEVKADSKHRVALGKIEIAKKVSHYRVYTNAEGLIVLDPQVSIPAREAWLYKNKKALKAVQMGIEDMKAGRSRKAKEDFSKYIDEQ